MKYKRLGHSGLEVSRICLGMMSFGSSTWRPYILDEADSLPIIRRAVESGINFFDTANMYSLGVSEAITGKALRQFARRDEVVIATKVYFPMSETPNQGGLSRKHIMSEVENSLRRLQTDYIDLYQIHRWDYQTPIAETLAALHDLVKAGKVRYIGASSMFAWQFSKSLYLADLHGWTRFISMQNHYNLIYREEEREMMPLCEAEGVGSLPWSPLARGFLAGNRKRSGTAQTVRAQSDEFARQMYYEAADFDVVERVTALAAEKEVTPAQLSLAWLLHKRAVVAPIVGCSRMKHLEEAVAAVEISLTDEEMARLEQPYRPHPVLGHR